MPAYLHLGRDCLLANFVDFHLQDCCESYKKPSTLDCVGCFENLVQVLPFFVNVVQALGRARAQMQQALAASEGLRWQTRQHRSRRKALLQTLQREDLMGRKAVPVRQASLA